MQKAKRSLSQNFLKDKNISNKIVSQINIKNRIVIEIGPGYGFLTDSILEKKPKKLFLIEKDNALSELLEEKYKDNNKTEIICEDILEHNFENYKNIIIISNLPYNISTKIILLLFQFNKNISDMVLMIQKEVAEKFNYNLPKMNKYKFLTKIVSKFNICFDVSAKVFKPKPKVRSAVVKFEFNNQYVNYIKAQEFSDIIFKNVRKKISNNLKTKKQDKLLNKRVGELTINELLSIYDFF